MMALQEVMGKIQSAGGEGSSEAQSGPPSVGSQENVSNSSNLTKIKMVSRSQLRGFKDIFRPHTEAFDC